MAEKMAGNLILQIAINGVIAGGILSLVSVGYNLIYGILRFINFAHGEVVTASAFMFFFLFSQSGLPFPIAVLSAIAFTILTGLAINRFVYRPLRKAPNLSLLVAAISLSLIIQAIILIYFKADVRIVQNPFPNEPIQIFGASLTPVQAAIILLSAFSAFAVDAFLKKTRIGKEIRATADNPELAATIGIDTERVITFTFLLASALAAVAGIMISLNEPINYLIGVNIGIRAFAASVIGGIGSVYGAFIGGYFLGMAENVSVLFIPSGYKDAVGFVLLIIFLLFRPKGILNTEMRRA